MKGRLKQLYFEAILLSCVILGTVLGYFWGKRRAREEFVRHFGEELLSDRISTAIYSLGESLGDNTKDYMEMEQETEREDEGSSGNSVSGMTEFVENQDQDKEVRAAQEFSEDKLYEVHVISFGPRKAAAAEKYKKRLIGLGIPARIVMRSSKNAKGKKTRFYQIVTEFVSFEEAARIAERLKRLDQLEVVLLRAKQ